MSQKTIWKTLSGQVVENYIDEIVKATANGQRVIHIGCDSQQHERFTEFVTVIVLLKPNKGGRVFYTREKVDRIKNLRERLLREVELSVTTALKINEVVSDDIEMNVHVDVNPNLEFKSSQYIKELVGYVVGCGFNALTKPNSWAAMHVADHVVKHKHIGRIKVSN